MVSGIFYGPLADRNATLTTGLQNQQCQGIKKLKGIIV